MFKLPLIVISNYHFPEIKALCKNLKVWIYNIKVPGTGFLKFNTDFVQEKSFKMDDDLDILLNGRRPPKLKTNIAT